MISIEEMAFVLEALPDPVFVLSRSGKYVAVFGGRDDRYYHDGSGLVGLYVSDVVKKDKANWFLEQVDLALETGGLVIREYELSNRDVKGLLDEGPQQPIWFEARIQKLNFLVEGEEVVLWVASNISERHEMEAKLRELSDTDQLTGLFNRRKLERDLTVHYEALKRHAVPTSILMFDLDNFKIFNDTHGHYKGDEVIVAVADIFRSELRKSDIACRFGGDEFIVGLPSIDMQHAERFAARLSECLKRELSQFSAGGIATTVSVGVATMVPDDRSYKDAVKRADKALYEAKQNGKNRVFSN